MTATPENIGPTVPERAAARAGAGAPALTPEQEALAALPVGTERPASAAALMALEMAVKHRALLATQAAELTRHGEDGVNRAVGSGKLTDGYPQDVTWGLNHSRGVWVKLA